jgi:hypothetical protein
VKRPRVEGSVLLGEIESSYSGPKASCHHCKTSKSADSYESPLPFTSWNYGNSLKGWSHALRISRSLLVPHSGGVERNSVKIAFAGKAKLRVNNFDECPNVQRSYSGLAPSGDSSKWKCPACLGLCVCAFCKRKAETVNAAKLVESKAQTSQVSSALADCDFSTPAS